MLVKWLALYCSQLRKLVLWHFANEDVSLHLEHFHSSIIRIELDVKDWKGLWSKKKTNSLCSVWNGPHHGQVDFLIILINFVFKLNLIVIKHGFKCVKNNDSCAIEVRSPWFLLQTAIWMTSLISPFYLNIPIRNERINYKPIHEISFVTAGALSLAPAVSRCGI